MFLKLGLKILFIAVEIFLGFYSLLMSDSLVVKFAFFVVTAGIIAFVMMRLINIILPQDNDLISSDSDSKK